MCSTKTPCPIPLFSTLWVEHIEIDHAVDKKSIDSMGLHNFHAQ